MIESVLVSVIVVNYNFGNTVVETLESVRAQSFQDFELIIIDDCSKDNSEAIIRDWLKGYSGKSTLIINEKNKGVCATLNIAFGAATGKYIAATAADDVWLPHKLREQVKLLDTATDDTCMVYSDAYLINEDGSARDKQFLATRNVTGAPQGKVFEILLTDNFIPAMSTLVKRNCWNEVGQFDENLVYEDYDMWLRLARRYQFMFSPYISCKYRIKEKSLSTSIRWDLPNVKILLKHVDYHPLVIKKLRELALRAYRKKEERVFLAFKDAQTKDPYIKRLLTFSRFRIPQWLGEELLPKAGY